MFALLGIAPGADISLPAAASLLGLPPAETRIVLLGLEQASLITQDMHGRGRLVYRLDRRLRDCTCPL
ncbi:hypothetical protein [Kibdelosporangium banguiense]|uniref:hypothetical protein n=1 Tax=Kibdelosporangium banguiense TaxID=1365924 RepID=UPI001FDA3949|nr:hypothetical protein [Kibdelosporangium banguiense]